METERLPTPFERALLKKIAKPPAKARQFSRVRIGPDFFRVERIDRRRITCGRYLKAKFLTQYRSSARDQNWVECLETRYAQLTDVIAFRLADRHFTLLRADWYRSGAASVHPDTRNVILDMSRGYDRSMESIIEAHKISYQVALHELPARRWGETPRCVVLDRYFDSRTEVIAATPTA